MSVEDNQPTKRGPGRPRKPAVKPQVDVPDAWRNVDVLDERIGEKVDDARWASIGFDDGRVYRIENGTIVERVS